MGFAAQLLLSSLSLLSLSSSSIILFPHWVSFFNGHLQEPALKMGIDLCTWYAIQASWGESVWMHLKCKSGQYTVLHVSEKKGQYMHFCASWMCLWMKMQTRNWTDQVLFVCKHQDGTVQHERIIDNGLKRKRKKKKKIRKTR